MITVHPSTISAIAIDNAALPAWVYATGAGNSYLVGAWFRRDPASSTAFRSLAFIQNNLGFRISNASITARVNQDASTTGTATITAGVDLNNGEWVFILCSVDKGAGTISICAKSAAMGRKFATAAAAYATGTHTPGKFAIAEDHAAAGDGGGNTYSQWYGAIGCVCVKNLQLSTQATMEAIVDAIFDNKRAHGILSHVGNGLNGLNDDWFAVNTGVPQTVDVDLVAGAASGARMGSTIVGGANTNYCWAQNGIADAGEGQFNVARPVTVTGTLTFEPDNSLVADFFQPTLPGITTNGIGSVNLAIGRRLYDNTPRGREKVPCISNSRAQRTGEFDADGYSDQLWHNYHQNHGHGFCAARFSKSCGWVNAFVNVGAIERRFAFDCDVAPYSSGTVTYVHGTTYSDFERSCHNNGTSVATGPGKPTRVSPAGIITVRVRDIPGSLFTKDKATALKVRYLNYPAAASSTFEWAGVEHTSQGGAGTATGASGTGIDFRTTQATRIFGGSDSYTAGTKTLVVDTNLSAVQVGWLVFIESGTGAGSIAEVASVSGTGPTTITLKHVFGTAPGAGSVLNFGPWSYGTFSTTLPARSAEFAGVNITNSGSGQLILVGADAETDDANGWVWGSMGWGGNGYAPQLAQQFTNAFADLMASIGADAVFMFNATQSSTTADRMAMADSIQAGVPDAEIAYISDQMHDVSDDGTWPDEALSQSHYAAVVATEDPTLGDTLTQFGRGLKSNASHPSIEGMHAHALASIALMAGYADVPPSSGGGSVGARRRRLVAMGEIYTEEAA